MRGLQREWIGGRRDEGKRDKAQATCVMALRVCQERQARRDIWAVKWFRVPLNIDRTWLNLEETWKKRIRTLL